MTVRTLAMVLFIVGGVLGIVAAVVPEAAARLTPLAITAVAFGLAAEAAG